MDREVADIEQKVIEACAVAANLAYRRHNNGIILDRADIRQELFIWAWKRKDKLFGWLDEAQDEHDQRRGWKATVKTLQRQADKLCRIERARRIGYETRDEAYYPKGMISMLLPHIWDVVEDIGQQHEEGPKPPSNPSEGGNRITSLFDVQRAVAQLEPEERELIEFRYRDEIILDDLASHYEVSRTTVDRRIERALDKLVELLGGESPWQ